MIFKNHALTSQCFNIRGILFSVNFFVNFIKMDFFQKSREDSDQKRNKVNLNEIYYIMRINITEIIN